MKTFNIRGSGGKGQRFVVTIIYTVLISKSFSFGGRSIIKAEQINGLKKVLIICNWQETEQEMLNSDLLSVYERMSYNFCAVDFRIAQQCLLEPNVEIFFYVQKAAQYFTGT